MEQLRELVSRIVKTVNPERIVLFGSRARGDNRPDSDWDFLIIQKSDQPRYQRAAAIRHAMIGLLPSKDIIVYTPEEVEEWAEVPNAFVTKALAEGKILYEKNQRGQDGRVVKTFSRQDERQSGARNHRIQS